jgi:hypothetical protein
VIDEVAMQLAMRARALTLSVATTGLVSLSATTTGYARTTGSFQTDGFWPGMEITPVGFATNTPRVITLVTPLAITVDTTLTPMTAEGAAGGRSLTVGLPSSRAWENIAFQPTPGVPWVEEQYLPGPAAQVTLGPNGEIEALPMYALYVNLPAETGLTVKRYVNALRLLFAPRTAITLTNGDVLRVRSDTGPFAAQLQQGKPGFAVQPLTIPFRLRTQNSI